ncbi:DinB family protein [Bacillus sp. DX1.1]|uniref:DinB family protein n=1 Tax=unclassified Bacillus (in: firmicutes) TaxID=185979 RepID=UPI00256FEF96|nr:MULTISPECIES: DinB family protein [unclassified Bacillus (in: firmicutes)]MDM5155270.1 DinB family protein [Bacillus sp. DX1.1]WJE79590.1 DinB family protein [Bacillus sp. DX3.1]
MHQNEYEWVRQTRGVLLDFCSELEPNDFTRQMDGFGWHSMRDTLVHIADCYNAWLGSFVLLKTKKPLTSKEDLLQLGLDEIKIRFEHVDSLVNEVFEVFEVFAHHMGEPIQREIPWRKESEMLSITPSKLLMHAITHEFHHKGQIVAIVRQMGYEPPNTDVLGTRE